MNAQQLNQETQKGSKKLDECSEVIEKALKTAENVLRECGLKIEVNLSSIEQDDSIKLLWSICLRHSN